MTFVHLHAHTEHSRLDGLQSVAAMVEEAARQGAPAIGISDHGSLAGAYDLWVQARARGLTPVVGMEAYIAPADRTLKEQVFWGTAQQRRNDVSGSGAYNHLTLIAADAAGLAALIKGNNQAQLDGFYRQPRWDLELLAQSAGSVIATTGCPGGAVQTRLLLGQFDEALKAASDLKDAVGAGNLYLELMDHGLRIERSVREDLLRIGRELGLEPVATNDAHFTHHAQRTAHDHLLCIGTNRRASDTDRFRFNGIGYHLRTAAEMRDVFADLPRACDTTLAIAERIGSYDSHFAYVRRVPRFPDIPDGMTSDAYLSAQLPLEKLPPAYRERARMELGVIADLGVSDYMLIVADLVRWAKSQGIGVGPGRGSAAGSLVTWMLGITAVDPLRHGLIFERFLNPDRATMPDIDLDFADSRRQEVYGYLARRYGAQHLAKSGTIGRILAKGAVRDVARVLGHPYDLGDRICRALPDPVFGRSVKLSAIGDPDDPQYEACAEVRRILDGPGEEAQQAAQIIEAAKGLEGTARSLSIHAGAAILCDVPVADLVPLRYAKEEGADKKAAKELSTAFPFEELEAMGLLKIDVLGLSTLSVIWEALDAVEALTGRRPTWQEITRVDDEVLDVFTSGRTAEVFQMDGSARPFLAQQQPRSMDDLIVASAITRPGPMEHIPEYLARRRGKPYIPVHPELAVQLGPILAPTLGIIVFQEQLMAAVVAVAGYTAAQADILRKVMSKKKPEVLAEEEPRFMAGCRERGHSQEAARVLWDTLIPFADYAFNKAHATAYTQIAVACAWLKAHHPVPFMIAALNAAGTDADKLAPILEEARRGGVAVLGPDVNLSAAHHQGEGDAIRLGLAGIKGVGKGGDRVVEERGPRPYVSFLDYLNRAKGDAFNKGKMIAMIQGGAFDAFGMTRRVMEQVAEPAVKRERQLRGHKVPRHLEQEELNRLIHTVIDDTDSEWDTYERYRLERSVLGVAFCDHPVAAIEDRVNDRTRELDQLPPDRTGTIAGLVVSCTPRVSKKSGKKYTLVMVEGADGSRCRVMGFDSERGDHRRRCAKVATEGTLVRVKLKAIGADAGFVNMIEEVRVDVDEATAVAA